MIQFLATNDDIQALARTAFLLFLTIWAYEEIVNGDSPFRRTMGTIVMVFVFLNIFSLFQ